MECTRCASPLEHEDLRCAVCGLPTRAHVQSTVDEIAARVLRCHGCGAAVAYDVEVQAPRCDFCASVMEIEVPEDPVEQAQHFVRFRVDERAATTALSRWLGTLGFFRPSDLRAQATIDALKPLWWVGWIFDAEVLCSWAADSNAGSRRSAWAPHAGQAKLNLARVVIPASRGLSPAECGELIPRYDIADIAARPEGHAHATVEQFDVQRSGARALLATGLHNHAAGYAMKMVPGSSVRNLKTTVLPTRLSSQRFAFPAYVLAYRYRDKLYRAIVHGQDPGCVTGTAPISIAKIALLVGGVLAVIAIIVAILSLR